MAISEEKLIEIWKKFANQNDNISINSDAVHVQKIAIGVLKNEEKHGLKYCPCRIRSGDSKKDLELICPCYFFTHDSWRTRGECWCGLFVKN